MADWRLVQRTVSVRGHTGYMNEISYLAVVVGGLAFFLLGALWYSFLFMKPWAADMGIDTEIDGQQAIDRTIPVSDLVKDIDAIFQMRFEAKHGPLGVLVDLFDISLSKEKFGVQIPENRGTADFVSEIGMTIADFAVTYDPSGEPIGVGYLAGVRVLNERADIDARIQPSRSVQARLTCSWLARYDAKSAHTRKGSWCRRSSAISLSASASACEK